MDVFENVPFEIGGDDAAYLQNLLGRRVERRDGKVVITRNVGHLQLPSGTLLRIRSPKAETASLLAWVAYVDEGLRPALRVLGTLPQGSELGDFAGVLAAVFVHETVRVARRLGLVRHYARREIMSTTLRGTLDVRRLAYHAARPQELPCVVWDRLPDTLLNQLLATATRRVVRDPVLRRAAGSSLWELDAMMASVDTARSNSPRRTSVFRLARNELAFETAAALARLLVEGSGLDEGTAHAGPAYLLNLELLFERAVVRAFRDQDIAVRPKHPVRYLKLSGERQHRKSMAMDLYCPDIRLVVDAKFTARLKSGYLQQMVTYCFVADADRAVLVVPKGLGADLRRSRFRSADRRRVVHVDVAELDVNGASLDVWMDNARRLVDTVLERTRATSGGER